MRRGLHLAPGFAEILTHAAAPSFPLQHIQGLTRLNNDLSGLARQDKLPWRKQFLINTCLQLDCHCVGVLWDN